MKEGVFSRFYSVVSIVFPALYKVGKTLFIVWVLMWIRWTFPRLRIDQVLVLEWKFLVPIGLINLLIMTICVVMGWTF